ncbi:MAG: hypothetical protein QXQ53_06995 [Candidatus Methanosuratincola sp.]
MGTLSVNWKLALLKQNPFMDVPPRRPEEAIWAGMTSLKKELEDLFVESLTTPTSQVVLNWGAYGSGKTHAAMYFGIPERLPRVEGKKVREVRILYIRTPKEPPRADEILYKDVIERLRFSEIRKAVRDVINEYGEEQSLQLLQEATESEALGKAIWLLGVEGARITQPRLFEGKEGSEEWERLLQAYFFSQTTKTDLKRLGLSRNISTARERFQVLGGLLHCFIGFAPTENIEAHTRLILWLDEVEDLIYFTAQQSRSFSQGLRDLVDRCPAYFTLLLNFTLATPESLEDAEIVLTPALINRVTHRVFFQRPSQDDAYEYVLDLLRQYRTRSPGDYGLPETYPFEEEALKQLVSFVSPCTPRELNNFCRDIVSQALLQGVISGEGKGIISKEFVSGILERRTRQSIES